MLDLVKKYNIPVPRYTSYPTVPFWKEEINVDQWQTLVNNQFKKNNKDGISLYLHLPFCETLCTYCGCNKKITKNHSVEQEYIDTLLKEWDIYKSGWDEKPIIKELHLGGGTPTFFSPKSLKFLLDSIFEDSIISEDPAFSIEGHPNNTSRAHLETLYNLGFKRISYGVQDNDPEVQRVINRIQPLENVRKATDIAREIGFTSVNFDLIYGLPLQNKERMTKTILESISLRPDRIAFYSYAHVPWTSRGQRLFDENDLPTADEKLELYKLGKKLLLQNGYHDIGMDHFALPQDELYIALQEGRLHRNFMGYTTQQTKMLLGLGVSSISDVGNGFAQNDKKLQNYMNDIEEKKLPIKKGYFLSEEDETFKKYILDLICNGQTYFKTSSMEVLEKYTFPLLQNFEEDGLIKWDKTYAEILPAGKDFIRIICSAFDIHLQKKEPTSENLFSKAI